MATKETLALRSIEPRGRVARLVGPSRRRPKRRNKHTRRGMWPDGSLVMFHMTQSPPWRLRARRRLHSKMRKATLKAHRR